MGYDTKEDKSLRIGSVIMAYLDGSMDIVIHSQVGPRRRVEIKNELAEVVMKEIRGE